MHALTEKPAPTSPGKARLAPRHTPSGPSASGNEASAREADLQPGFGPNFSHIPLHSRHQPGLPTPLRLRMESWSGLDLSDITVHRHSSTPARFDAHAVALGNAIHLAPGQEQALAHEAWHMVQRKQGRVAAAQQRINGVAINTDAHLEQEADQMGQRALTMGDTPLPPQPLRPAAISTSLPIQRQVRTNGGKTKVNEAHYLSGKGKAVGSKRLVSSLIGDAVRRVFKDTTELESFANGSTDYIGDVLPQNKKQYWYRLPPNKTMVLGEVHENKDGNVVDVITGVGTSRFKYEPFNEISTTKGLAVTYTNTQTRLDQVNSGQQLAGQVDRKKFNPDLENIVIKALTGAAVTRNQYIPANPASFGAADIATWGKRASTRDYSFGERIALYLSIGMHLASDVAKTNFGPPNFVESAYVASARALKEFYLKNQTVLDAFSKAKDGDDLIGIYELTMPGNFKNLPVIKDFTIVFHEYASRYIAQLGAEKGNKKLEAEGNALAGNPGAQLDTLSPAREEIIWEKLNEAIAKGFLIVGMGDAHRQNLTKRLDKAGIAHDEVVHSLEKQKAAVDAQWKA